MRERLQEINTNLAYEEGLVSGEEVTYEEARDSIRNPENFAKRIESSELVIEQGVTLKSQTIELGDGHFTNIFDLKFDNNNPELTTEIITRHTPIYAHRMFVNEYNNAESLHKPIATINGAFFFLQDEMLDKEPAEIIYNLNIRNKKVVGLPSVTRPALFVTRDGHIHAEQLEARGLMTIGGTPVNWIGGEPFAHNRQAMSLVKEDAILYNSGCCTIEYENPSDKTSLRKVRKDLNHTPSNPQMVDIVVVANEQGGLSVQSINPGGNTDFFEGNFILHVKKENVANIHIGDTVDPINVGDLNLDNIESAMTTGPEVEHFLHGDDHEINHDPSLGTFPPFAKDTRYARSVIYEDSQGFTHMVVFDAVPRSTHMKGVTPKEVAEHIPDNTRWAVFLDGGQSSRITFENNGKIDARGNNQYVRLHKLDKKSQAAGVDDRFLWTKRGRPINSMIMLSKKK